MFLYHSQTSTYRLSREDTATSKSSAALTSAALTQRCRPNQTMRAHSAHAASTHVACHLPTRREHSAPSHIDQQQYMPTFYQVPPLPLPLPLLCSSSSDTSGPTQDQTSALPPPSLHSYTHYTATQRLVDRDSAQAEHRMQPNRPFAQCQQQTIHSNQTPTTEIHRRLLRRYGRDAGHGK